MINEKDVKNFKELGIVLTDEEVERLKAFYKRYLKELIIEGMKKHAPLYQINIRIDKDKDYLVERYLVDELNGVKLEVGIIVNNVNLWRLRKAYDNNEKNIIDEYKHLIMYCLDEEELKNFQKGDKVIDEYRKEVQKHLLELEEKNSKEHDIELENETISDGIMSDIINFN